jgi:hypothetical protein
VNHADTADAIRQHRDLGHAKHDYRELVRYATLAASSHNTQPWKFRLESGRISILPDFTRRCPAVDPDDHHLYSSLGCATENLLLAAQAAGLQGRVTYDASESSVKVDLTEAAAFRSPLFEAIPLRQCNRAEYDGSALSAKEVCLLEDAARGAGVSLLLLTDPKQKEDVAGYVARGNSAQFMDRAWASELKAWIRFSAHEALRTGDGLYGPVMGNPSVPRWLGELFMRVAFSAGQQNEKDRRNIHSSAAVAVLVSEVDDKPHWIEAGRSYERLALQATALGLCTAFINQPVEVAALRSEFAAFLGVGPRRPDLVVRIGRGRPMPQSLRRPVDEVVLG